jgi:hypothetical protein
MLINKWLVTDCIDNVHSIKIQFGFCLYFTGRPDNTSSLYKFIQRELAFIPFSIILSEDDFNPDNADEEYMEKIIALFFQPSYYMVNYHPVLFLKRSTLAYTAFLDRLQKKCSAQGLKNILIIETRTGDYIDETIVPFGYCLSSRDINLGMFIKNWLAQYLIKNNSLEMHILISDRDEKSEELFDIILKKEEVLKQTNDYKIANILYEKEKIIEDYKHQLSLKDIDKKNNELYLSVQKSERANALEWYYYEYEILPVWYKRFGHIVKVLIGKRTFKSLFNDNVKKYKE